MDTNVLGSLYMIHKVIDGLVSQGSGTIVNISSVAGRTAKPGSGIYNASKWAVNAFSESLCQEVTQKGVRIVLIEPGAVMTELNDHITDEDSKKKSEDSYASMRSLQADDVARDHLRRDPARLRRRQRDPCSPDRPADALVPPAS